MFACSKTDHSVTERQRRFEVAAMSPAFPELIQKNAHLRAPHESNTRMLTTPKLVTMMTEMHLMHQSRMVVPTFFDARFYGLQDTIEKSRTFCSRNTLLPFRI